MTLPYALSELPARLGLRRRLLLAVVLVVVARFLPVAALDALAALAVLTIGIAHGAVDPVLARRGAGLGFYVLYVSGAAAVFVLWFAAPAVVLAAFIVASVIHFGEGDTRGVRGAGWAILSRGCFVTLVPLIAHAHDVAPVVRALGVHIPPHIFQALESYNGEGATRFVVAALLTAWHARDAARTGGVPALAEVLVLATAFFSLPLVPAFALYFTVWHSADHLRAVRLRGGEHLTRHAIIGTGISWLAIAAFLLVSGRWVSGDQRWSVLFGFLAAVTAPHMFVVARARLGEMTAFAGDP